MSSALTPSTLNAHHVGEFIYRYLKNEYSCWRRHHKRDYSTMATAPEQRWMHLGSALTNDLTNAHVVRLQELHEYNLLTSKAQSFLEQRLMEFTRRGRFSRRRTKYARNDDTRSIVRELHIAAELVAVFFPPMLTPWRYRDGNALVRRGVKACWLVDGFGASLGMTAVMRATEIVVRERENNRTAMQLGRLMREGRQREECPYCVAAVEHVKHEEPLPVYEEGGACAWQSDDGLPSYDEAAPLE